MMVELRKVKQGDMFRRKPDSNTLYIRHHYNRKDQFGPSTFRCTFIYEDIVRSIQLTPSTIVHVD